MRTLLRLGKVVVLSNAQKPAQRVKENKWRNMFQTDEQDKSPGTSLSKTEITDLSAREFKITVMKMLTKVRRAKHEQNANSNRETENTRK